MSQTEFLVMVAALICLFIIFRKGSDRKKTGQTDNRERTVRAKRPAPHESIPWHTLENMVSRKPGWVRLGATSEVAGTHMRQDALEAVVSTVSRGDIVEADLFREPENPHDKNAVQVYIWTRHLKGELLGYIPRDQALMLTRYSVEMPLSCEISSIRTNGRNHYVKLVVLIPPKKERVRKGWEPQTPVPEGG